MNANQEIKVVIGIQARSTSSRLPGKVFAMLGDKPVLQHVIDAAKETCAYLNAFRNKTNVVSSFYILCPKGDPIKAAFERSCNVLEGSETDVLSRYRILADHTRCDFLVRITGDCPLIPSYLITKHINVAVKNNYDYVSNVDERIRTQLDGFDCEVFSTKLLQYTVENTTSVYDREHVTTFMRKRPPQWAKTGHVISYIPMADLKLSIDTQDDLDRVRDYYGKIQGAIKKAEDMHGIHSTHRF